MANGKVFREYIGANWAGVTLDDVPIDTRVDFHFILSFAVDYETNGTATTNGEFHRHFEHTIITPEAVSAIKSKYSNVKVMLSIGGDSVNDGLPVQFNPTSIDSWVSNAVSSLTALIQQYHLDGIDINYEHFDNTTSADFTSAIGRLVHQLRSNGVISIASIAPFDDNGAVANAYTTLWSSQYRSLFDYVNFQFYATEQGVPPLNREEYINLYNLATTTYHGGKVLASFNTAGIGTPPPTALEVCQDLQNMNKLPGIFVWNADHSRENGFTYERQAQALLARAEW